MISFSQVSLFFFAAKEVNFSFSKSIDVKVFDGTINMHFSILDSKSQNIYSNFREKALNMAISIKYLNTNGTCAIACEIVKTNQ